jgi:hypothetical protein
MSSSRRTLTVVDEFAEDEFPDIPGSTGRVAGHVETPSLPQIPMPAERSVLRVQAPVVSASLLPWMWSWRAARC